jgi:hypothetical protein
VCGLIKSLEIINVRSFTLDVCFDCALIEECVFCEVSTLESMRAFAVTFLYLKSSLLMFVDCQCKYSYEPIKQTWMHFSLLYFFSILMYKPEGVRNVFSHFKTVKITTAKHNSFIKSKDYVFRPQTVIIRPYNN